MNINPKMLSKREKESQNKVVNKIWLYPTEDHKNGKEIGKYYMFRRYTDKNMQLFSATIVTGFENPRSENTEHPQQLD